MVTRTKPLSNALVGLLTVAALKALRLTNPERMSDFAGAALQKLGPWLSEHRTGRANLTAAFPEKSAEEIERILGHVWENLGRVGAEYAHLDRLWDYRIDKPGFGRIHVSQETVDRFVQLRDDGKPALIFAAHLANWELPGLAAAAHGLDMAILYRPPNIGDVSQALNEIRSVSMGTMVPAGPDAAFRIAAALERGQHVGMLIDQHFSRGVDVTFFGRTCKANPMLARLARHFDCPIHGVRVIRLPGGRFELEVTDAVAPARLPDGAIDVAGTMQAVTSVVEAWVREHPEQWLWLHRRWR